MNSGYEDDVWGESEWADPYDAEAQRLFPNVDLPTAQKQRARLQAAKEWMRERGLLACVPGSKFVYVSGGMKNETTTNN